MMTATVPSHDGNYEKYYATACFDAEVFTKGIALFDEYKKRGVILNDNFGDKEWKLTNQLRVITISFGVNELLYHSLAKPWIGCGYENFTRSLKAYAVFRLGSSAIETIREIANTLRKLSELTQDGVVRAVPEYSTHAASFLSLLPGESVGRDIVIEALEEKEWCHPVRTGKRRQRVLAELGTYFRFNDTLQSFWTSAQEQERLFWFPLYLWWTLTAILPLRTTEFLLTPRKCLDTESGKTFITLRRTLQKGNGRKFVYRIENDYETVRYAIPDKMVGEIMWYLRATEPMEATALDTLFAREPHYAQFGKKPYSSLGYYTYGNLSTCLQRFQLDVMGVAKDSMIQLGDTRHLAMIGLILSGGSPLICKELAGHADINISAHYYSNISTFIECATFEFHRKSRVTAAELVQRNELTSLRRAQSIPVQDGFCDSVLYRQGEINDCIKSISPSGELGDCHYCPHFIDVKSGMHFLYADPAARKKQVDRDSRYLLEAVEAVRRGLGFREDITTALLRLQQSGTWYGQSLKNEWEEDDYGKTKKNDDRTNA